MEGIADEKLSVFALRLVLSDHLGIPQEHQPDLLTEAEQVFVPKNPRAAKRKKTDPKTAVAKAALKKAA